jgi:hypothetical protein
LILQLTADNGCTGSFRRIAAGQQGRLPYGRFSFGSPHQNRSAGVAHFAVLDCYTQFAYSPHVWNAPMTVVETERFLKDARALLAESERAELVAYVAANPEAGDVIPETGGVRKLR